MLMLIAAFLIFSIFIDADTLSLSPLFRYDFEMLFRHFRFSFADFRR